MVRGKKAPSRLVGWLIAPVLLVTVLVGVAIVKFQPLGLWGPVVAVLFAIPLIWIVISVLWPAHADRTCPECGSEALVRMDPHSTHGVACTGCGWSDETQSSWLLAEEEGPLEQIVLEQRRRKRSPSPRPGNHPAGHGPAVDTTRSTD